MLVSIKNERVGGREGKKEGGKDRFACKQVKQVKVGISTNKIQYSVPIADCINKLFLKNHCCYEKVISDTV